jgi:hypothetical protein
MYAKRPRFASQQYGAKRGRFAYIVTDAGYGD